MAGSSLLLLLDDIAAVLDDVATMTKVAARKTAGVLGDDLAVNAEKVTGVRADRELPVVWAVAKGSFRNKLILVPAALALSLLASWAITPLLVMGGLYLCYEGFEKIAHSFLHGAAEEKAHREDLLKHVADPSVDLVKFEQARVKGAIRTDFILSAEIIVLTLGIVADRPFRHPGAGFVRHRHRHDRWACMGWSRALSSWTMPACICQSAKGRAAGLPLCAGLARPGGICTLADESPVGGGHRGHVHGGRRYPGAWFSCTGRMDRHR